MTNKRYKTKIVIILFLILFMLFGPFVYLVHKNNLLIIILKEKSINKDKVFIKSMKKWLNPQPFTDNYFDMYCFSEQLRTNGQYNNYKNDLYEYFNRLGINKNIYIGVTVLMEMEKREGG